MNRKQWDDAALILYCMLIFWLSSQSTLLPSPFDFEHKDKLIHATAYAVMALLAWQAFAHRIVNVHVLFCAAVGFASLYGISDEFHQSFVAGRNADVWDWLADTLGASLAALILYHQAQRSVHLAE